MLSVNTEIELGRMKETETLVVVLLLHMEHLLLQIGLERFEDAFVESESKK